MVELLVALSILTVCGYLLSSTITATMAHAVAKREMILAAQAARNLLEDMRNQNFADLYALYNDDPNDDPDGVGTGFGGDFAIRGLDALEDDADGMAGRVTLPASTGPLLETIDAPALTMPRDLNGDSRVDGADHSTDYIVLPVTVTIEWDGYAGPRSLRMQTMLADLTRI